MTDKTKPRWPLPDAVRRGQDALVLCIEYRATLEPRLSAGLIARIEEDLGLLEGSPADRQAAKTVKKGKTGAERDLASEGHDWVMLVRNLAQRSTGIAAGTLTALGVGENISDKNTNAVQGAMGAILAALDADPDLPPKLGLVPDDLEEARALASALGGADQAQTASENVRKAKTFDKNVTQLRLEAAVDEVSSRGQMAYRKDAVVRARFAALVATSHSSTGGGGGGGGGGGPTPPAS